MFSNHRAQEPLNVLVPLGRSVARRTVGGAAHFVSERQEGRRRRRREKEAHQPQKRVYIPPEIDSKQ